MKSIKTILHPTDFSKHSEYAAELACALARDREARLVLLHVLPPAAPVTDGADLSVLRRAECGQQELRAYREEMRHKLQQLPLPGLPGPVEYVVAEGEVAPAILRTAQNTCCDLIVMGTHGWTGKTRELMGSVAEEVMQKASCPVITAKVSAGEILPEEQYTPEEADVIL
jgi:nucleotide-binding universal stress UspA family protein